MTPAFRLTQRAFRDLQAIAAYTRRQWGEEQSARYLRELDRRFAWIAENPAAGRSRQDVAHGTRSIRHRSHIVFYRIAGTDIDILAIIHGARDIATLD